MPASGQQDPEKVRPTGREIGRFVGLAGHRSVVFHIAARALRIVDSEGVPGSRGLLLCHAMVRDGCLLGEKVKTGW